MNKDKSEIKVWIKTLEDHKKDFQGRIVWLNKGIKEAKEVLEDGE